METHEESLVDQILGTGSGVVGVAILPRLRAAEEDVRRDLEGYVGIGIEGGENQRVAVIPRKSSPRRIKLKAEPPVESDSDTMNYSCFEDLRYGLSDQDLADFEADLSPINLERYQRMEPDLQLTLVALSILTPEQIMELLASQIPPNSPYSLHRNLTILGELQRDS